MALQYLRDDKRKNGTSARFYVCKVPGDQRDLISGAAIPMDDCFIIPESDWYMTERRVRFINTVKERRLGTLTTGGWCDIPEVLTFFKKIKEDDRSIILGDDYVPLSEFERMGNFEKENEVEFRKSSEDDRVILVKAGPKNSQMLFDIAASQWVQASKYRHGRPNDDGVLYCAYGAMQLQWHSRPNIPSGCIDGIKWLLDSGRVTRKVEDLALNRQIDKEFAEVVSKKKTNPKDAVGTGKWRQFSVLPMTVIWELAVALLEGARKYGRHNYRDAGVRASVYVDAAVGHIGQFWEGEDIDADSGLSHITKAIASLVVMRDSMIRGNWVDDRPPAIDMDALRTDLQAAVDGIMERIPDAVPPHTEKPDV